MEASRVNQISKDPFKFMNLLLYFISSGIIYKIIILHLKWGYGGIGRRNGLNTISLDKL